MAGHSKWANIKHRKGAQDAKRAKLFAKLSREIMVAVAMGGPEPDSNPTLRLALSKARANSMPKKNIESAINRATGNNEGKNLKEIIYGGNIAGVSFLVIFLSDNPNKVTSIVQHLFNKAGGSVTGASSVSYIFSRKGVLEFEKSDQYNDDQVLTIGLENDAQDVILDQDDVYQIYCEPNDLDKIQKALNQELKIEQFTTAQVSYIPSQKVLLPKEKALKIVDFIDKLEDEEDVQEIFDNLDQKSFVKE